jgi:hypothetical protein
MVHCSDGRQLPASPLLPSAVDTFLHLTIKPYFSAVDMLVEKKSWHLQSQHSTVLLEIWSLS